MTEKERKPKIELVVISEVSRFISEVRRFCLPNTPEDVCDPWWEEITDRFYFNCDPWVEMSGIARDDKIKIEVTIKKLKEST